MRTDNDMNPYRAKHVRHGMKHFLYGRAIQGVFSFLVMVLLVRYMSVVSYAGYVTATGLATLLAVLSMLGMDRVTTRYLPEGRLKANSADLERFVMRLRLFRIASVSFLCFIIFLFWGFFSSLLKLGNGQLLLSAILAYSFTHAITSYQRINLQSLMLQEGLRKATSLIWMLRLSGLLVMVVLFEDIGVELALWVTALSELAGLVWMSFFERSYIRQIHTASSVENSKPWPGNWRPLYRFGWQNYSIQLIGLLTQAQSLRLLAAIFLTPHVVAAYGFFQALAENVRQYLPLQLFRTMFEPVALAHHAKEGDFRRLNDMISTMLKMNMLVISLLSVWFFVGVEPIVGLMTGGKYLESTWILVASMVPIWLGTHFSLILIIANAVGMSGRLLWGSVFGALSSLALIVLALKSFGMPVLIATTALASMVANFYAVYAIRRHGFDYRIDWWRLFRVLAFAVISGAVVWLASQAVIDLTTIIGSIQSIFVCLVVFSLLNWKWKPFAIQERELLVKLVGSKMKWIPF